MARNGRRWRPAALAGTALLTLGGCGSSVGPTVDKAAADKAVQLDTSKETTTVHGTVTINGKPASGGEVVFDPRTSSRTDVEVVTEPISNGSYSVKTNVGMNQIKVTGPEVTTEELKTTTFSQVFQPGDNTFDIVLPRK